MRIERHFIVFIIMFLFCGLLVLLFLISPKTKGPIGLVVYDVHTDSPRIVSDDGSIDFSDYVRIRNITDHTYDLRGLYLSDSGRNLRKLPLEGIVLEPGESQMIKLDPSWNFALKGDDNENVYLSDGKGGILFKYTPQMKPEAPELSAQSGFYEKEFYLRMSVNGNNRIYYTIDGSEPDENSEAYINPIRIYDRTSEQNRVVNVLNTVLNYHDDKYIDESGETWYIEKPKEDPVDKAFVIRAIAMDKYGNRSETVTREFFFCGNKYKSVLSIVADPDDLFGDYGIASTGKLYDEWYLNGKIGEQPDVNFDSRGREWEIPAFVDYFIGEKEKFSQNSGMRVQGKSTRFGRIKNFQLVARKCYSGSDVFNYDFFGDNEYRCHRVNLDDSFKESFFLSLVENEEIIKQKTTDRIALFLNGEFWNNIYIRNRMDKEFFFDYYSIPEDNLIVLLESFPEIGGDTEEDYIEARNYYLELDEYAKNNDLSISEKYSEICNMMDMDNYIDYLAINIYAGVTDWGEYKNDLCWRVRNPDDDAYCDGRFRWVLHDADTAFEGDGCVKNNEMITNSSLLNGLLKNERFKKLLYNRITELGNTTFSEDNICKVLDSYKWDETEVESVIEFLNIRHDSVNEDMKYLYAMNKKENED